MFYNYMCMSGLSVRILNSVFNEGEKKTVRWFDERLTLTLVLFLRTKYKYMRRVKGMDVKKGR